MDQLIDALNAHPAIRHIIFIEFLTGMALLRISSQLSSVNWNPVDSYT